MTFLSGMLAVVAIAMMAALVLLAVRRERDIRRNSPSAAVRGTTIEGRTGDRSAPPAVR